MAVSFNCGGDSAEFKDVCKPGAAGWRKGMETFLPAEERK
jgi:hypothetical protein